MKDFAIYLAIAVGLLGTAACIASIRLHLKARQLRKLDRQYRLHRDWIP